ncbi:trans-aconitate 2-methyltransferase, partial [Klebsiella pneumoniae]
MADWNPSLYLQFDAERTRPAADLLSRIAHLQVEHAVDLGCGPGNSTRLLRAAWPLATIVGIDNSPAMLVQAAQALPDCEFIDADIARWRPAQPPDVIYANASLQWLTDHETLFPHLVNQLADNGTLAVQMPDNWQEPSHTLMRQVASEMGLPDRGRQPLLPPAAWYDLLSRQGCEVDIWRT